jgi:hypothetical protein
MTDSALGWRRDEFAAVAKPGKTLAEIVSEPTRTASRRFSILPHATGGPTTFCDFIGAISLRSFCRHADIDLGNRNCEHRLVDTTRPLPVFYATEPTKSSVIVAEGATAAIIYESQRNVVHFA